MRAGGIFGNGALGIVGGGVFGNRSLGMIGGGVFGRKPVGCAGMGALGIDPPFPDVYGCNTDSQCQSGWCNTSIPVSGANGQCQTRGKVNPGVGGDGKAGSYCSSNDNCTFGLQCNMGTKMCESTSDPGNVCYIATQMGFQDGLAGLSPNTNAAAQAAQKAGVNADATVLTKAAACYTAGYSSGTAQSKLDTRACTHVGIVQRVQRALGTSPTGKWSSLDQAALQRSGKSYKSFAPACTGAVPTVPGTGGGGTTPGGTTPGGTTAIQPGTTQASLLSNPLVWAGLAAAGIGAAILLTGKKKGKRGSKSSRR